MKCKTSFCILKGMLHNTYEHIRKLGQGAFGEVRNGVQHEP